jgi:flagellar hook-length control protein FliK
VQPATTDSSDSLTAADAAGATQVQPEVRSSAEVSASGLTEFGGTSGQTLAQDAALTAAGRSAVDRVQPEAQLRQADQQGVNAANDAGSTAAVSDVSAVALPGSQSVEQAGPQPMTEQIRHVVVQHVQQNADTQSSRLTVRLDPPELGVLELDLSLTEDGLDVKIHARENVTLDMLLARSPELERLLKAQDLNIRKVEVDALIPEGSAGYSGSNEQQSQTEQRDRTAFSDVGRRHPASGRNHQADVPVQRNNRRAAAYGFRA